MQSFYGVSGKLPGTLQRLCVSTKFMHQKLGKITLFYVVLDVSQGSEHGFEMGKKTVTSWNQFSYGEKTV